MNVKHLKHDIIVTHNQEGVNRFDLLSFMDLLQKQGYCDNIIVDEMCRMDRMIS